jgi:hypothetical protein
MSFGVLKPPRPTAFDDERDPKANPFSPSDAMNGLSATGTAGASDLSFLRKENVCDTGGGGGGGRTGSGTSVSASGGVVSAGEASLGESDALDEAGSGESGTTG